jgi:hypothetical protein
VTASVEEWLDGKGHNKSSLNTWRMPFEELRQLFGTEVMERDKGKLEMLHRFQLFPRPEDIQNELDTIASQQYVCQSTLEILSNYSMPMQLVRVSDSQWVSAQGFALLISIALKRVIISRSVTVPCICIENQVHTNVGQKSTKCALIVAQQLDRKCTS